MIKIVEKEDNISLAKNQIDKEQLNEIEKSIMILPYSSTGSICFNPP